MIGIQLEGDGDFLELKPDTSIDLTLENPLLGDDDNFLSPGSFSLPFAIPAGDKSPANAAKLKNSDVIENNQAFETQRASLFFQGTPFKKGTLRPESSAKDIISTFFTFGLNSLNESLKTAKLRAIFNEPILISADGFTKEIYLKRLNANNTGITVNGETYVDDSTSGLGVLINDFYDDNMVVDGTIWLPWADLINVGNTPGGITPSYLRIRMAQTRTIIGIPTIVYSTDPHIELSVKLQEDATADFAIEVGDLTNYYADFKTFVDPRLKFPIMFNATLHEADVTKTNDIINSVDAAGDILVNDPNFAHNKVGNHNSLQPFILLKYVLDTIAEEFEFEFDGDFYDDPALQTMLIDNSEALDLPMDLIGESKFIFWRRSFNLNELLPDWSVIDFFKALKSRYNIGFYYNDQTGKVRLKKREAIALSNDYDDITKISSPILADEDQRVALGINLFQPKEDSDLFSEDESLVVGVATDKTHEIKCGRLFRTKELIISGGLVSGPYVSRKHKAAFGFRIFHYAGLVDNGTYEYQAASINANAFNEVMIGVDGLYANFWTYWLYFESRRRLIRINTDYPFRLLRAYEFEQKRRYNRINYLVKSVSFKIQNDRVSVSDVQLYTMK